VRPRDDLSENEISVVLDELKAQSSMIMMIFRFFLQSGEYQFFLRRLKNVVMTKASLSEIGLNENNKPNSYPQQNYSSFKNANQVQQSDARFRVKE